MGASLCVLTQKEVASRWTVVQEKDFQRMKQLSSSSIAVKPFDQQLQTKQGGLTAAQITKEKQIRQAVNHYVGTGLSLIHI